MKISMQKILKVVVGLIVITALHHITVLGQDSTKTKVIIIKEYTDKDGNKTIERIV